MDTKTPATPYQILQIVQVVCPSAKKTGSKKKRHVEHLENADIVPQLQSNADILMKLDEWIYDHVCIVW